MSIMSSIGRYGAAIRRARRDAKSVRDLNSLPSEIQKDIGWPVEQDITSRKLRSSIFPGR